jgi:transposase
MALRIRPLSTEEYEQLRRLAQSRTAPARLVERAKIVWLASQGQRAPAIATALGLTGTTVRLWLKRFNVAGAAGLTDRPRAGRPATYTPEQVGEIVAAALTKPDALGLPFGSWTLDRLQVYLHEVQGVPIKRSRLDEILIAEGLRWRTQETWFGERVDPAFAQKRGPSSPSTPRHLQVVR